MNDSARSSFVYVTFIRTTPERLWSALTTPDFMKQYWFGSHIETDWRRGAPWKLKFPDGRVADGGEILECDPPHRLVLKWRNEWNPDLKAEGDALFTVDIEPEPDVVKLTITHAMDRAESRFIAAVTNGWPRVLSNLKSLLETGHIILSGSHAPQYQEAR